MKLFHGDFSERLLMQPGDVPAPRRRADRFAPRPACPRRAGDGGCRFLQSLPAMPACSEWRCSARFAFYTPRATLHTFFSKIFRHSIASHYRACRRPWRRWPGSAPLAKPIGARHAIDSGATPLFFEHSSPRICSVLCNPRWVSYTFYHLCAAVSLYRGMLKSDGVITYSKRERTRRSQGGCAKAGLRGLGAAV